VEVGEVFSYLCEGFGEWRGGIGSVVVLNPRKRFVSEWERTDETRSQ
jgi:hypothetical protein